MIYSLDTEFIEGFHISGLRPRRHHVDLISLGLVREDGYPFYAISSDFDPYEASEWVVENVFKGIIAEAVEGKLGAPNKPHILNDLHNEKNERECMRLVQIGWGMTDAAIGKKVKEYVGDDKAPVFYGYFADYDWVVFCSLFGTMMDLPKGWPMYCRDLKQELDLLANEIADTGRVAVHPEALEANIKWLKNHRRYPVQTDGLHNALADAMWNLRLLDFIKGFEN
jgi:hypothetical protein